jgi:hypothetical protein
MFIAMPSPEPPQPRRSEIEALRKPISPLWGWGGSGLGMAINMALPRSWH